MCARQYSFVSATRHVTNKCVSSHSRMSHVAHKFELCHVALTHERSATLLIRERDMTHLSATWLVWVTHLCVWHNLYMCATSFIQRDMTHSLATWLIWVRHDSFECIWVQHNSSEWLICVCDTIYMRARHDSFVSATWLICVQHDFFECKRNHSSWVRHDSFEWRICVRLDSFEWDMTHF